MKMSSFKEYVKSSIISFIAAFAIAVLAEWGHIVWSSVGVIGLISVGARAGVKAILEMLALIKPTTSVL